MERNKLLIISGATATGKTGLSILLSKKFTETFEVVNFDSLLFYKEVNIGTAKPTEEELEAIPHHLVNVNSISDEINANDFVNLAEAKINELHKKGKIPILVGGSTFYLRSLIKGMYESQTTSQEIKDKVEEIYKSQGISPILDFLSKNDPVSLESLHENDHYRLLRAYEHFLMTGLPISQEKEKFDKQNPYDFSNNSHPEWDILHLSMELPKEEHWQIMEERALQMIKDGLIEEVKTLLNDGFTGLEKPMQSIGYKETVAHILKNDTEVETLENLAERIYINTRRLAKSQKTFLKKVTPKEVFNPLEAQEQIIELVSKFLAN